MQHQPFSASCVKAVLFDANGTLAFIAQPRRPYARLLKHLRDGGHPLPAKPGELVMTEGVTLSDLASRFGEAPSNLPEKARGLKVGVFSNLALPYAEPGVA